MTSKWGASRPKHMYLSGAAILVIAMLPSHAFAQAAATAPAADDTAVEEGFSGNEIVVTARKRAESLDTVPVAVSALGESDLGRYSITNLSQIADQVPTVVISKTSSGSGGVVSIRGIGTSPGNGGFESSVTVNVDGVQISRGRIATQSFFDIQQVEILKGPQALFFGKNSPAGVISLTSKGPTDRLEGYATFGYEFVGNEPSFEGAISGPLSDTLGFRVAVRARSMDGYLRNAARPIANPFPGEPPLLPGAIDRRPGEDEVLGRVTLQWDPSSRFKATLKLLYSRYNDDGPAQAGGHVLSCGTAAGPETSGRVDPYGNCLRGDTISNGAIAPETANGWRIADKKGGQPFSRYEGFIGALNLQYDLSDTLSLASTTGYFSSHAQYFDNFGGDVWAQKGSAEVDNYEAFSQEVRLNSDFSGPFNFMLGAYYQSTSLYFANVSKVFALGRDPARNSYVNWDKVGQQDGKTISFFGQGRFEIMPALELAGGVRWTHEKKDSVLNFDYLHPVLLANNTFSLNVRHPDFKDNNLSPEMTLSYQPTRRSTVYVSYRTGYKSGGANLSALVTPRSTDDSLVFGPEKVKGFEAGAKGTFFDGRLRAGITAYQFKFRDLQVSTYDTLQSTFIVNNAARVTQKGVELDARFEASEALSLRGAVTYNQNRFKEFTGQCFAQQTAAQGCVGGIAQNFSGRPTTRSPDWSGNFGATYETPVSGNANLSLTADTYYSDGYFVTDTLSPYGFQKSFWRFDASARVSLDNWELALVGRNLSNRHYLVYGSDKPGTTTSQTYGTVSRGREVSVKATYRF